MPEIILQTRSTVAIKLLPLPLPLRANSRAAEFYRSSFIVTGPSSPDGALSVLVL